jgi:hypothetical protein
MAGNMATTGSSRRGTDSEMPAVQGINQRVELVREPGW